MNKVTRSGKGFDLTVQCVIKRPDEAAQEILDLREELDKTHLILEKIYDSGDYSSDTELLIRESLGLK